MQRNRKRRTPSRKRKDTQQELLDRIETLEKELQKLEEENKARKSLEVTEEEKTQKEKEVLEAVGREYSLSTKGTLSIDYSLSYQYSPTETFATQQQATNAALLLICQSQANHTFTNSIYTAYSPLDNLTTSMNVPIVYRYDKLGTSSSLTQTDLGDISPGVAFQAPSSWKWLRLPGELTTRTAWDAHFPQAGVHIRSTLIPNYPRATEHIQLSFGSSFSKQLDPVVLFWSLGYSHSFPLKNLNYTVQETYTLEKVDLRRHLLLHYGNGIFFIICHLYEHVLQL